MLKRRTFLKGMASLIPLAAGLIRAPEKTPRERLDDAIGPVDTIKGASFDTISIFESEHCPQDTIFFMREYAHMALRHPRSYTKITGITEV